MRKPPLFVLFLVLGLISAACMPFTGFGQAAQSSPKAADIAQTTATLAPTVRAPAATVGPATPEPEPTITPTYIVESPNDAPQPVEITGTFTYTNPFVVETYFVEQAVSLSDMHGFVIRDQLWTLPIDGQTLGYLKIDPKTKTGTFQINLPGILLVGPGMEIAKMTEPTIQEIELVLPGG